MKYGTVHVAKLRIYKEHMETAKSLLTNSIFVLLVWGNVDIDMRKGNHTNNSLSSAGTPLIEGTDIDTTDINTTILVLLVLVLSNCSTPQCY
jgi:hypothetical protein